MAFVVIYKREKKLWQKVHKKLTKQQESILKPSQGPFPNTTFEEGTPVYAHLPNQEKVPCVILQDFGNSCLVDKGAQEPTRYRTPVVHKSMLTRRLDGLDLTHLEDEIYNV